MQPTGPDHYAATRGCASRVRQRAGPPGNGAAGGRSAGSPPANREHTPGRPGPTPRNLGQRLAPVCASSSPEATGGCVSRIRRLAAWLDCRAPATTVGAHAGLPAVRGAQSPLPGWHLEPSSAERWVSARDRSASTSGRRPSDVQLSQGGASQTASPFLARLTRMPRCLALLGAECDEREVDRTSAACNWVDGLTYRCSTVGRYRPFEPGADRGSRTGRASPVRGPAIQLG